VRIRIAWFTAGVAFAVLAAGIVPMGSLGGRIETGLGPAVAHAQNFGQRIVRGTVVDASSTAVVGATVFLKDIKSKRIRSYTTDAEGHFRFTQVYMAEDHELWAEKDTRKSVTKTISTWDTRPEYITELKLK
jgi:hypothetical protein